MPCNLQDDVDTELLARNAELGHERWRLESLAERCHHALIAREVRTAT